MRPFREITVADAASPGCDGLAAAIAKGEAPVNGCPVGGDAVGKVIAGSWDRRLWKRSVRLRL